MATKKSSENKSRDGVNLSENLEKLAAIAAWFDDQEEVDIEEGLLKVKMKAPCKSSSANTMLLPFSARRSSWLLLSSS